MEEPLKAWFFHKGAISNGAIGALAMPPSIIYLRASTLSKLLLGLPMKI
jgi:hypothetical protein